MGFEVSHWTPLGRQILFQNDILSQVTPPLPLEEALLTLQISNDTVRTRLGLLLSLWISKGEERSMKTF